MPPIIPAPIARYSLVDIAWRGVVESVCLLDNTESGCTSMVGSDEALVPTSTITVATDVFPNAGYGTILASSKSCAAFEKQGETSILINGDGTGCTSFVRVSGDVTSECGDALTGAGVTLTDGSGDVATTSVASDGSYGFEEVPTSNNPGTVSIDVPNSFAAGAGGPSRSVSLAADATADFALECIFVDITGTVASNCVGGLAGVTVDLVRDGANAEDWGGVFITSTGPGGAYSFENIRFSDADTDHISIVVPLGFEAVTPEDGASLVSLEQDGALNFTLQCNQPSGQARSMGYWKHQTNVHLSGRGTAQESAADMSTNYPDLIFNHFHENLLNAIEVKGVTYVIESGTPAALDLETIDETLSVRGNAGMLAKAKQQYLAMLLNMAPEKLLSVSVVSADGATASQALQYAAFLINDGSASNDEQAKNICDTINNAQLVAAGVIPLDIDNIVYALPRVDEGAADGLSLQVSPNPGRHGVYSFALDVPAAGEATLAIYDTSGRLVATPLSGAVSAGRSQVAWDARSVSDGGLSQGVYFARLITPAGNRSVKIVHMNR